MEGCLFKVLILLYGQGQARYRDLIILGLTFRKNLVKNVFLNLNSVSFRLVIRSHSDLVLADLVLFRSVKMTRNLDQGLITVKMIDRLMNAFKTIYVFTQINPKRSIW
jgi:hypothetical protein